MAAHRTVWSIMLSSKMIQLLVVVLASPAACMEDGEAQPAAIQIFCKAIPLDQAHDEAMPLVECALTPIGHCRPLDV
ncbi:hypothetical protein PO909_033787 [Leuciscus waleckii]